MLAQPENFSGAGGFPSGDLASQQIDFARALFGGYANGRQTTVTLDNDGGAGDPEALVECGCGFWHKADNHTQKLLRWAAERVKIEEHE